MHVSVLPRGGKTTIRVSEGMRALATALFGGLAGGISAGTVPVWLGIGIAVHSAIFTLAMGTATASLTYGAARGLFGRAAEKREVALRELAEKLAQQARESIAAASSKLPPPDSTRRGE